jgi:hypothetical protein
LGGFGPSDVDDCWLSNFRHLGSSGNLGNLFSGRAIMALPAILFSRHQSLFDFPLSRLPIYSITKSIMALPAILFSRHQSLFAFPLSRLPIYSITKSAMAIPAILPLCQSERCRSIRDGERGTPRMFAA